MGVIGVTGRDPGDGRFFCFFFFQKKQRFLTTCRAAFVTSATCR
jgi:hypothetical protein